MRYHLTSVRKTTNNNFGEDVDKREPSYMVGKNVNQWKWKTEWKFLQKVKLELRYDLVILLLGISEENENTNSKDTYTPIFRAALFYNSQDMKGGNLSVHQWMNK